MTLIGRTIGHIRLEALLGSGGMGEVYRGFDEKLQRHVAVKTIRAEHRLSEEMKARFLREARILSKLAHPAICQVYDLFEEADTDYLIFELVDGLTLGELAKKEKLAEPRILELGIKIADALAVAHREKIVHRDLKPHNVMVTPSGAVKVLDFGLALAFPGTLGEGQPVFGTNQQTLPAFRERPAGLSPHPIDGGSTVLLGDGSTHWIEPPGFSGSTLTPHGTVVGTIHYMSPEQARGAELEPASDLFSLGIVLQELLTGERAYPDASGFEFLQMVAFYESLPIQGVDPEIARLVEDLKHPSPGRRPNAVETAERLRWLLERPLRQRRRQLRVAAATAAFVVLALVLALVSFFAWTAAKARDRAEGLTLRLEEEVQRANREAETANQVLDFVVDLFGKADPSVRGSQQNRDLNARELVVKGINQIGEGLENQPAARARLQSTLGSLASVLGEPKEAVRLLEESLKTSDAVSSTELVQTLNDLGTAYLQNGQPQEAQTALERARKILDAEPQRGLAQRADNSRGLGVAAIDLGDFEGAAEHFRASLGFLSRDPASRPQEVADALVNLAALTWQLGRFGDAEALYHRALNIHDENGFPENPSLANLLNNLGILNRDLGHLDQAEAFHRRAIAIAEKTLGLGHPDLARMLDSLARLLNRQGRGAEALPLLRQSLAILEKSVGNRHSEVGVARVRLADALRLVGDLPAAALELRRGQSILTELDGPKHFRQIEAAIVQSNLELARGRKSESRATLERALALALEVRGPDHPETRALQSQLTHMPSPP